MISAGAARGRIPKYLGVLKTDGKIQCTGKNGCSKLFNNKADFAEHGTDSRREGGHGLSYFKVCPAQDCLAAFQSHSTWQTHNSQFHSTGQIKTENPCQGCGVVFPNRATLNRHKERAGCGQGLSWFHQCPVCYKFFVNNHLRNGCTSKHNVGLPPLTEEEYRFSHPSNKYKNVTESERYGAPVAFLDHHRLMLTAAQLSRIADIRNGR